MIIKLLDDLFSHEPDFLKTSSKIVISRESIKEGDVVIYTDTSIYNINPLAKINIALLVESPDYHSTYYDYIYNNNQLFDLVLTYNKKLLDKGENIKFYYLGTTWLHPDYQQIYTKDKLCSMILSSKTMCKGHRLRHEVVKHISNFNVDLFGHIYKQISRGDFSKPQSLTNEKILALKNYNFSIIIENCQEDYYFTEKIIDCFLSGSVPIYWGCPSIHKFFNIDGIYTFNTIEELLTILNNISPELYISKLDVIEENFNEAKKYVDFKLNEKEILNLCEK